MSAEKPGKHRANAKGHPFREGRSPWEKQRKAARQRRADSKVPASQGPRCRWRRFLLPLAIFCWPIFYLFRHVFPINGQYTAMGNDFILLYYKYKVYLLACLADFHFPLWSPAEGAGYPFNTNPFTQAFYPFNLLLVVWYKISGGYDPLDHQVFTVLGISIFALGLFMWLRLINSNLRAVVFGVLVMSVSFKVTEITRFPNAVHTAAWYPWILYALTKICLSKSLKNAVAGGMLLTLFLILLLTAGYPYYVYYCLFLFAPYMLVFLVKPLRLRLLGPEPVRFKRAFCTMILAGGAAMALCAPYIIGIKRLMDETIDRAGKDFGYSTSHIFNFEDTLGSLVYPPAASAEGWYFFSITGLLLILLYMFTPQLSSHKPDLDLQKRTQTTDAGLKLFFILWIFIISYVSYGRHSYLFRLLWNYMPGFSSLRVWGRLNIILVPIFAWLLSIAYASFESLLFSVPRKRSHLFAPIAVLAGAYSFVLFTQLYLYHKNILDTIWLLYFKHVSGQRPHFIVYGAAAFIIIFSVLVLSRRVGAKSDKRLLPRVIPPGTAVLAVLVLVATVETRHVGARMWTPQLPGKTQKNRIRLDVAKMNEASFQFRRTDHSGSIPLGPNFSVGVMEPWYFTRYNKFLKETKDFLFRIYKASRHSIISARCGSLSESRPTVVLYRRRA